MKKVITLPIIVITGLFLVFCTLYFLFTDLKVTYPDCGKVVSKSSDEVAIKHGSKTELYLNVQFQKSGFRSVLCEPTTYFQYKIGDKVCFNIEDDVANSGFLHFCKGVGFFTVCTVVFIVGGHVLSKLFGIILDLLF